MFKIVATIYLGLWAAMFSMSYAKAAEPIKVAVIDTGLDLNDPRFKRHLCPGDKHWNFVYNNDNLKDEDGHGTHVTGLITKYAKNANYCLLIYRFYKEESPGSMNGQNAVSAILKAIGDGATIINMSWDGPDFNEVEYNLIKNAPHVTFVVAAGNQGQELKGTTCRFPPCYELPNLIVVGSKHGEALAKTTNRGARVNAWEDGVGVLSTARGAGNEYMSGTSMSAAIYAGKLVYRVGGKIK